MKRLHRMALGALFAAGYPLMALAQHDHAAHGRQKLAVAQGKPEHQDAHAHKEHAGADKSAGHAASKQTTCPVSGKPIDKDVSVEYQGRRVYFCCKGCPPKFEASPTKYLPALYKQIYPQAVQVKCPVMGGTVNPEVSIEHEGRRVYFCCKGCDKKFKADPDKYAKRLAEVSTTQVHCPVMGGLINPELSADVKGEKVYFCCKMCEPKYKADPSKYPVEDSREVGLLAHGENAKDDLLLCPVCAEKGIGVHKRGDVDMVEVDGLRYAMCGRDCAAKFKQDKGRYLQALHKRLIEYAGGEQKAFVCPMHPQIVSETAGPCPVCGMKLKREPQRG